MAATPNKSACQESAAARCWHRASRDGWFPALALMTVTILAYLPVWRAGFIWDDDTFLTNNPVIQSPDGWWRIWLTASTPDYFPLTSSCLWVEWRLWGGHALGFHLVNVFLHAGSAVLLWRVLLRLNVSGAWLGAALFALHPVNVESVAWITERKNTLAMLFFAGALLAWLKFEDEGRRRWYGVALGSFALALLSKTAVAPLPLVLLTLAWWRRGRIERNDAAHVIPFFALATALGLVTVWFQSHRSIGHEVIRTDGFFSRLMVAGAAVWFYLYKALVPLNLAFVYPRWDSAAWSPFSWVPFFLLASTCGLCWRFRRTWGGGWFTTLACYVVMLLPVLGFVNIYFMRYSLVADHWQYFAIVAPLAAVASIIKKPAPGAVLLVVLGVLTWRQCGFYLNAETLWRANVRIAPASWMPQCELGDVLLQDGRLEESMARSRKALRLNPVYPEAHNNLGVALFQSGRIDEAIAEYQQALDVQPDDAPVRNNLGNALARQGRLEEAVRQYEKALEEKPDYAEAHNNLGNALLQEGKSEIAMAQYQRALEISPRYLEARINLGTACLRGGRPAEAVAQYQQALEFQSDSIDALKNLAWVLATCPDAALRDGAKALELAKRADALTGGRDPLVLRTLAAAWAETGKFSAAGDAIKKAMALTPGNGSGAPPSDLEAELKRYEAGLPVHR